MRHAAEGPPQLVRPLAEDLGDRRQADLPDDGVEDRLPQPDPDLRNRVKAEGGPGDRCAKDKRVGIARHEGHRRRPDDPAAETPKTPCDLAVPGQAHPRPRQGDVAEDRRNEGPHKHPAKQRPHGRGQGRKSHHCEDRDHAPGDLDQHRAPERHLTRLNVKVGRSQPVQQRGGGDQRDEHRHLRFLQHRSRRAQRSSEKRDQPGEAQDTRGRDDRPQQLDRPRHPQEMRIGSVRFANDAAADTDVGQKLHRRQEGDSEGKHPEGFGHQKSRHDKVARQAQQDLHRHAARSPEGRAAGPCPEGAARRDDPAALGA